jgi:hypothetical protein
VRATVKGTVKETARTQPPPAWAKGMARVQETETVKLRYLCCRRTLQLPGRVLMSVKARALQR